MRKIKQLLGGIILIGQISFSAQSQDINEDVYQKQALDMLKTSVAMRTAEGFGLVPKLAEYFAGNFKKAGFEERDINLIPMGETAVLIVRYRGDASSGKKPILLSAHLDVVDALPEDWERDPFTLMEENGFYYGRGSEDNKFGASVLATTLMRLKSEGFVPKRDIIMAYSGDEETLMLTTRTMATEYRHLIDAEYALVADGGGGQLDEETGEAVSFTVDNAEKTYASFEMTARNPGGHSSLPRKDNAIGDLAVAINKIIAYDFPVEISELTRSYFSQTSTLVGGTLGDAMKRFAENTNDADAVKTLRSYPEYIGSLGTTCVPTLLRGGHGENALPQSATATINCRIFPGIGVQKTLDTLKHVTGNDALQWTILDDPLESDASPMRDDVFGAIERGVRASYPGLPIIPHMASGASDALHFRAVGIPSYTFSGIFIKSSDQFPHGLNERVPTATLPVALRMWYSILKELTS